MSRLRGGWPPLTALLLILGALAGCGGDDPAPRADQGTAPSGERASSVPTDTVVAAVGDSITAGSPLWDPDAEIRAGIGSSLDRESQWELWAERRMPGVAFRNCGVFGERTDQIAGRLEGCAKGADMLIVQGGINDIAQDRRVITAARNLLAMVRHGKRLGLRVALAEVLPWNNGSAVARARIRRLNRFIGAIGKEERVPVYPWYKRLEDLQSPGRMKPEWTIDGDHPSVEGYRRLADVVRLP